MSHNNSRKKQNNIVSRFPLITKVVIVILLIIIAIFAIDYCSVKTNTHNAATEVVHTLKERIQGTFSREDSTANEEKLPSSANAVSFSDLPEFFELPLCPARKNGSADDHQIRTFDNYALCYRESYEEAEWSAYCLEKEELTKNTSRSDDFRPDPAITTGSSTLADYKGSGFDRGHLAPAADFAFSDSAMSQTFFMSNMTPQAPGLNREIWQYLESQVRTWAQKFGKVYVICGPVLEKSPSEYPSIGQNQVTVPEYFYKVVLTEINGKLQAIGFIIPNNKCPDTFWNYAVSIDEVEKRTGLDFFSALEDSLEDYVEKQADISIWK